MALTDKLTAIGNAIRNKKGTTDLIPLANMPSEIESIETGGGYTQEDIDNAYEQGKQEEYNAFWDRYQENGTRTAYSYAFTHTFWNDETFKPKYPFNPTTAAFFIILTDIEDLTREDISLNFSKCNWFSNGIYKNNKLKALPNIDCSAMTRSGGALSLGFAENPLLETLTITSSSSTVWDKTTFQNDIGLKNLEINGVIGKSNFDVHWSVLLTKQSITSIINALSTTTNGLYVAISKTAKENAFTAEEWATLIATKQNWTISLV
jgi:hypothetical protein